MLHILHTLCFQLKKKKKKDFLVFMTIYIILKVEKKSSHTSHF